MSAIDTRPWVLKDSRRYDHFVPRPEYRSIMVKIVNEKLAISQNITEESQRTGQALAISSKHGEKLVE